MELKKEHFQKAEAMGVRELTKQRVTEYTMKLRLYPSAEQKKIIDQMFLALHVAYNITFHHVFLKDPRVCTEPREDGSQWPSFSKMAKAAWLNVLKEINPIVEAAPAAALSTNGGLFLTDAARAWETGMHSRPIDPDMRREFHFYNAQKPRRSFYVQIKAKQVEPSPDNEKVAWIRIPKVGRVKARGFNPKLRFGENGMYSFSEALQENAFPPNADLSVRVSKDNCDSYYISILFSEGKGKGEKRSLYLETPAAPSKEPIGLDVGVKDIAILSNGQKVENKQFHKQKQPTLSRLNRQLSRRWGPANPSFRDYNKAIRQENRTAPEEEKKPLAQPSQRYLKGMRKKALIDRKIARRRNTYYHQQTASLVRQSSLIAVETLKVTNMMKNHRLAYALADAAMSDFLAKIKYKADRFGISTTEVGTFEPTSQLCSCCGEKNPQVKNLSIRAWTCPHCGARHDRDINAARNILRIALQGGTIAKEIQEAPPDKKPPGVKPPRRRASILPDRPELAVVFSKELTRPNDPRYIIKDTHTGKIIDDAQGTGYRSATKARNCYIAKLRWAEKRTAENDG